MYGVIQEVQLLIHLMYLFLNVKFVCKVAIIDYISLCLEMPLAR